MSLAALKLLISPPPRADVPGLRTGIAELDAALPGGVPRGRLTEIAGRRGSGRTTLVRALVGATLSAEGAARVAVIDGTRTLSARDWSLAGARRARAATEAADLPPPLVVVRPPERRHAAWCADVLLRSGAFALLVLDGAPPLARAVAVRLERLAREHGAALVVVGAEEGGSGVVGSALRLRTERAVRAHTLRALRVVIEKGGSHQTVEVECAVGVARRLCAHPEVPDRRGVARRAAERRDPAGAGHGAGGAGGAGGSGGRRRRAAEPDFGRAERGARAERWRTATGERAGALG